MNAPSRRRFLVIVGRVVAALVIAPTAFARQVVAASTAALSFGPSAAPRSIWVGRGCSAVGSALSQVGAQPSEPYVVDFAKALAVVVAGVDAMTVSLGASTVIAPSGTAWALLAVDGARSPVALIGDGGTLTTTPEGA